MHPQNRIVEGVFLINIASGGLGIIIEEMFQCPSAHPIKSMPSLHSCSNRARLDLHTI